MADLEARDIEYFHAAVRMLGAYRVPTSGRRPLPGLLVIHGAFGLGNHIIGCAERVASLGYAVLAVDLWGDRRLLTDPADIGPTLARFEGDRAMWMGRLEAARAALASQHGVDAERIGGVGYCFGGSSVLEFARTGGAVRSVVSFHGGLDLVGDDWFAASRDAKVLILSGADDPMATPSDLARLQQSMTSAGMDWQVILYGSTKHAFTEAERPGGPPFAAYNAQADRRSWNAMQSLFDEVFAR